MIVIWSSNLNEIPVAGILYQGKKYYSCVHAEKRGFDKAYSPHVCDIGETLYPIAKKLAEAQRAKT